MFCRSPAQRLATAIALLLAALTMTTGAHAQGTGSRGVELDDDRPRPSDEAKKPPLSSPSPPPPSSDDGIAHVIASAQRFFDERRWGEAAPLLYQASKATNLAISAAVRELAQYHLGIA